MTTPKDPLAHFLKQFEAQSKTKQRQNQHAGKIAEEKNKQLIPVRMLLKQIQDLGLNVHHADRYSDRNKERPPQLFEVFENESSPSFLPGVSIFFDHPAVIEIAIPNHGDTGHPGVISICCTTHHPDRDLLHGPFSSVDQACIALAEFIARSTISMSKHRAV